MQMNKLHKNLILLVLLKYFKSSFNRTLPLSKFREVDGVWLSKAIMIPPQNRTETFYLADRLLVAVIIL